MGLKMLVPGRIMKAAPRSPTPTAIHRRVLTFSPSKTAASIVINYGAMNTVAVVSPSGSVARPVKKNKLANTTVMPRSRCKASLWV